MAWTDAMRKKARATIKRNAKLRKAGKLPGNESAIALDNPMFEPKAVKVKALFKTKPKGDNREVVLRLLALIERLI